MKKTKSFNPKTKVFWKWLGREIHGKIISVHLEPISKVIKGKNIKRNGSPEKPAYVVESEAGNLALKLHTELNVSDIKTALKKLKAPKIFQDT